jgi:hypothetical protein
MLDKVVIVAISALRFPLLNSGNRFSDLDVDVAAAFTGRSYPPMPPPFCHNRSGPLAPRNSSSMPDALRLVREPCIPTYLSTLTICKASSPEIDQLRPSLWLEDTGMIARENARDKASQSLFEQCSFGVQNRPPYRSGVAVWRPDYRGSPIVTGARRLPEVFMNTPRTVSRDRALDESVPGSSNLGNLYDPTGRVSLK